MTFNDWLGSISSSELHSHLIGLSDRKLHLLTAAFLRRVWDDLPSHQTRTAVEAAEAFADGRITARELSRIRSTDVLESCEGLWLGEDSQLEEQLIGIGWECPCCEPVATEYECHAVQTGDALDGVLSAVKKPAWTAVRAALHAREIVVWKTEHGTNDEAEREEARAQYELFREIVGPGWTNPNWPQWRTSDVLALARGIHRDQAFDRLPILADALQDAGCDDETVLAHCRRPDGHARGCWVVDLAMGIS
jgi:hypothetical protein